jgi:hypothetical protein
MGDELFVPEDFAVPDGLIAGDFRLTPLGAQHNEADYAAWTSSIEHIRATPGFRKGNWPRQMSLADNLRDLQRHARDFAERRGFTYTVLSTGTGDVIGCVYIYPPRQGPGDGERRLRASVQSWVRADHARSTRPSTTPSPGGWSATGRLTRSTTPRGPDPRHPGVATR